MSELSKKLRMYALHDGHSSDAHVNMCEVMHKSADALEARDKAIAELVELTRDLSDCLDDMTKHYVEVRNDLYGFEAAEEVRRRKV